MEIKETSASKYLVFFVLLLGALFLTRRFGLYLPITITTSQISSELSVVGEGKVELIPDTAYLDAGITVEKLPTAEEVQAKLSTINNNIISAVKALGLKDDDIKTSNYSINPNYVYSVSRSTTDGYTGNATITIKTSKIDVVGKIIEAVTKSGATNVGGARFAVDKPETFREKARDAAINNAKEQAQKLASSLGITLGRITNIVESNSSGVPPMYYAGKAVALDGRGGAPTPEIQPGTQTITSTVTLYFEKR